MDGLFFIFFILYKIEDPMICNTIHMQFDLFSWMISNKLLILRIVTMYGIYKLSHMVQ